jgi:hypothetical protein
MQGAKTVCDFRPSQAASHHSCCALLNHFTLNCLLVHALNPRIAVCSH